MISEVNKSTGVRWWMIITMLGLSALVASRFANVKQIINGLRQGRLPLVVVAVVLNLLYFVLYAGLYQVGYETVGVKARMLDLVPLVFVSLFVNALVPTGRADGAAIFIDDAIQRGQSAARTAVGVIWVLYPFSCLSAVGPLGHSGRRIWDWYRLFYYHHRASRRGGGPWDDDSGV
jgi:uncharacterized membrane protein YbhN (UPF0104 family)